MAALTQTRRILLSAYACEPARGSEPGVGWNWAIALARQGHDVWVITRANNRTSIELGLGRVDQRALRKLHFEYFDLPRWVKWWKRLPLGTQLYYALWQRAVLSVARSMHRQIRFDLVQHITFGVWRHPSMLYRLGIPFIFGPVGGGETAPLKLERAFHFSTRLRSLLRRSMNALSLCNPWLRQCLSRATLVVSKTPETAAWIERAGRAPSLAIEIGVDASEVESTLPARAQKSAPLSCIFAGRLIDTKGVHLAIEACSRARQRGADVMLTVVGKGPMRSRLIELTKALGVEPFVRFIEWLPRTELFGQYRMNDLLLFPSMQDSSGNVVLEAQAHGLAVVCLDLGGPAVLVDATCGVVVATDGRSSDQVIDALAEALRTLQAEGGRLSELRRASRERALAASWDAVVRRTYDRLPPEMHRPWKLEH